MNIEAFLKRIIQICKIFNRKLKIENFFYIEYLTRLVCFIQNWIRDKKKKIALKIKNFSLT